MGQAVDELWAVARQTPHVDAETLARAIEAAVDAEPLDYRTRLLIRDGVRALEVTWGSRFETWLNSSSKREKIKDALGFDFDKDEFGFATLPERVVDAIQPESLIRVFRELSAHVSQPTRIVIGGSVALTLGAQLTRHTDDIDVVDEVPAELRNQHELLADLKALYGLQLT